MKVNQKFNSYIDDDLIRDKLRDKKLTAVAESTGLTVQTLYNFMGGKTQLSLLTKCKLVTYFLTS
jgi:DNA-binding phage protein